jgi:hypothetical protein
MSDNGEYKAKLRSIGFPRKAGAVQVRKRREDGARITEVEHWDGRQDATITPATVRYGARTHGTGKKKGEVAEVRELTKKEGHDRYGDAS